MSYQKQYKTVLRGKMRGDFMQYAADLGVNEAEALRHCVKAHIYQKETNPEIKMRLKSIEILLRELNKKV